MLTDHELIKEIQKGSVGALEVLIKRHYKLIYSYIYRQVGDYHTAYDLTQETFTKLAQNIHTYKMSNEFIYWLFKIALNTCRDHFRSKAHKIKAQSILMEEIITEDPLNLIDLIEQKIESSTIKKAVMELPDYQREAILLRFFHDLKVKHIAEITGAGESTVKSRIKQGLSKLKVILERNKIDEQKKEGL